MNRTAPPARPLSRTAPVFAALLTLLPALPACGPSEFHHPVYPTSGIVTSKGEPVDNAIISFHPVDPKTVALPEGREGPQVASPTTQTDDQGKFSLSTYYADDGAPAGDYKVTVVWARPVLAVSAGEELSEDDLASGEFTPRKVSPHGNDKLKGEYADLTTTPLKASVTPDGPNRFEFALD